MTPRKSASIRLCSVPLETRLAPAVVTWDGGGGSGTWSNANNWDGNKLPTSSDDVVVPAAFAGVTITSSLAVTIATLNCAATLAVNNNAFAVTGEMAAANVNLFNNTAAKITVGGALTVTGTLTQTAGSLAVTGGGTIANASLGGTSLSTAFYAPTVFDKLTNTGSFLTGGTGSDFTVTTAFNWSAGALVGPGLLTLPFGSKSTISGSVTRALGRTIKNSGELTYSATGVFWGNGGDPGIIDNLGGGTLIADGPCLFDQNDSTSEINNEGTFIRQGTGTSVVEVAFNNLPTGVIQVEAGVLQLTGGATLAGLATAKTGTKLTVTQGVVAVGPEFAMSGAGQFSINGTSATVTLSGTVAIANLEHIAGTLNGSGELTIDGSWNWTAGLVSGTSAIILSKGSTSTISSTATRALGRRVENYGTLTYSGSGLTLGNGSGEPGILNNNVGGVLNAVGDGDFNSFAGIPASLLSNAGTMTRSGVGTTTISLPFVNSGLLTVSAGAVTTNTTFNTSGTVTIVALASMTTTVGNYVQTDGKTTVDGTLDPIGNVALKGGTLSGAGTIKANVDVTGGTLTPGAAVTLTISGAVSLSAGTAQAPTGGVLNVQGAVTQSGGTIDVVGQLKATGTYAISKGTLLGTGNVQAAVANSGGSVRPGTSPGQLTITGSYTQSGTASFDLELTGPTVATQYDQLKIVGAATAGANLAVNLTYAPAPGVAFTILSNDLADKTAGTFAGLPENGTLLAGGARLRINYAAGDGNDVTLTRLVTGIDSVTVDDGTTQRSLVRSVTVAFGGTVAFPPNPADAFQLTRTGPGTPAGDVALTVDTSKSTANQTVATLTFGGSLVDGTSLIDGRYQLSIFGGLLGDIAGAAVDADGNGTVGGTRAVALHRLFGDADGDADVDNTDFVAFRTASGGGPSIFDSDGDGDTDNADFMVFRAKFGTTLP